MPIRWSALLCGLLACGAAHAEARYLPETMPPGKLGITRGLTECLATLEGQSVGGRRACLGEENRRQDARLNRAYAAAMKRLGPERREILRRGQRAWLQFVPAQCELEAGPPTGGTDWSDDLARCDLAWRAHRALFLESLSE